MIRKDTVPFGNENRQPIEAEGPPASVTCR